MKNIKSIQFKEAIFIPTQHRFEGSYPHWSNTGRIKGRSESGEEGTEIEVILVNCRNRDEISATFEKEINMIKGEIGKHPEKEEALEKQIEHFENLKNKIQEGSVYRKEPSIKLLEFLKMSGFPYISSETVIFLSGVSNMVED